MNKMREETEQALAIFCLRCRMEHPRKECPLDQIEVCRICNKDHATHNCPSLPGLKSIYRKAQEPKQLMSIRSDPDNPNLNV
jgi:hypothetical protein